MATNKTVYTLDLDTSRLINNYKAALKEMKNAGVSTDVTKGLEDQLKKLETEYKVLANAGKAGFTNTAQITNFNKRVEKLMTSFRGFETELGGVSGKIHEVAQNSQKAGQKLQNAFSRVGFKNVAQQMQTVLNATDREAKLTEVVNEELKKRAQAVAQLKAEYEAAAQAAQVANTRISADALSSNATAKINGKSMWTSGKNKPDEATRQAVVAQAQAIAQAASSGQQAWAQFCEYLRNNGLDKVFNKQALPGVEDTIKAMQANYANAAPLIEQAQQAQQRFNEAQASFNQIGKNNNGTLTLNRGVLSGLIRELNNFNNVEEHSLQVVNSNILSAERLALAEQTVSNAARNAAGSAALEEGSISNLTSGLMETAQAAERTSKTFEQIKTRITMFFSVTTMFNALRNQIRKTYNDVKQLDKSFASIAMVTKYSVNDMWKSYSQYAEMAGQLGQKTDDVVKASALFYQQGLDTNESLALTADTMKLATIAGNDYQTATKEMTSALRGFKMEMDEGAHVTDVYSELAAHAAARVDDIAQAMARTASIANSAGMSFENTSAFLTQMIETTQESAENIGTSLKTIIARFTELKNNVAGTSESEFSDLEYNKVDKALKSVGVQLKDVNGQFRNLDDVFLELSKKWDTLDRNTQRYVATIAAGSRQQSRFIAMMDNYERTAELMDYAADAEGKADEQFAKYADTMEYKLNQLSTTWEEFRVRLMDSDLFKGVIDGLTTFVSRINAIDFTDKFNIGKMAVGIPLMINGIKTVAKTLTSSIQQTIGSIKKIGANIGRTLRTNLSKSLGKPIVNIEMNYRLAQEQAKALRDKLNNDFKMNPVQIKAAMNARDHQDFSTLTDRLNQELKNLGLTEEEVTQQSREFAAALSAARQPGETLEQTWARLSGNLDQYANAEDRALRSQEQYNAAQRKASAYTSLATVAVTSALSSISAYANGVMEADEAAKMFAASVLLTATQLGVQAMASKVADAMELARTRHRVENGQVINAVNGEEASSWLTLFAAQNSVLATTVLYIAIIGAQIAAVAIAIHLTKKFADSLDSTARTTKHLAESQKLLKDATQDYNSAKNESNTAQKELKDAKELQKKYLELNDIKSKSSEQEEEYKDVIEQIQEQFPEIITSYDEINNKLTVSVDLWDAILEKQTESAKIASEAAMAAGIKEQNIQKDVYEAENELFGVNLANGRNINSLITEARKKQAQDEESGVSKKLGEYLTKSDLEMWGKFTHTDMNVVENRTKAIELLDKAADNFDELSQDEKDLYNQYTNFLNIQEKNQNTLYQQQLEQIKESKKLIYAQAFQDIGDSVELATFKAAKAENQSEDVILARYTGNVNATNRGYFANLVGGGIEGDNVNTSNNAFTGTNFNSWDSLDNDIKKYISLGIGQDENAEEFYNENRKKNQEAIYQAYLAGLTAEALNEFGVSEGEKLTEAEISNIEKFMAERSNMSDSELDAYMSKIGSANSDTTQALIDEQKQRKTNALNGIYSILGFGSVDEAREVYKDLGADDIDSYVTGIKEQMSKFNNDEKIKDYFGEVIGLAKDNGLSETDALEFIKGFDWSEANALNWEDFKEKGIKQIKETFKVSEDSAEFFFKKISNIAKDTDALALDSINGAQVSAYLEKISKIATVFKSNGETLSAYIAQGKDEVEITADEYEKLQKVFEDLKEAGVENTDELVEYNELTGKWKFNVAELNKIMSANTDEVITQLNHAKVLNNIKETEYNQRKKELENKTKLTDEEKEELATIEEEVSILEAANETIDDKIDGVKSLNAEVEKNNKLWKTSEGIIELTSKQIDGFSKALSSFSSDGFMSQDSIGALSEVLKASGKSVSDYIGRNLQLNTGQLYADMLADIDKKFGSAEFAKASEEEKLQLIALRRELITTYDEYLTKLEEEGDKVTKAIKEKEKADKAYADQLEDVTEKQEKLNEALKEYNELLNGSDNRKSSLDYLYNYDEAITSFNDEISRSKDLMADSKTIQDSATALTRYAQATHNLIAEETAKQDVIKQGLANYANMIENGSYSYTNRETGATTNINFGNYAKRDSRTGKYIIDQRLLNESKFADKWKDQLEEQVSMYNKYADELLKSEDNVRKAEKEIRDERNAALKKYVSMEKEIADALKAAYQEEVDQLKNKYDSMKDADDDYIDALQKAIEKQRKLRKQEQGFEDLAKKEKKLSLMSRDTSGANAIETRKLEEEIKKDRESLLDEAIDNVIDELSKLYESQEKLRDEEMELKEALLDNTLYWNSQAEALAGSFESGEEYAQYLSSLSKEYAEMTLAMQQDKLNDYGKTYTEATEYMAMVAMDTASETGDFIVDTLIVTGEEVSNIVAETAESFTTEVVRSYNETTAAFIEDMQKAEEAIDSANKALQEAYEKLNECAQAANKAAEEVAKAYAAANGGGDLSFGGNNDIYGGTTANSAQIAQANYANAQAELENSKEETEYKNKLQQEKIIELKKLKNVDVSEFSEYRRKKMAEELKAEGYFVGTVNNSMRAFKRDGDLDAWLRANAPSSPVKRYLNGGLADYTGYAYVDGTPEEPEGFLTAEQTQAIGDAAKIFSDIPWLDHSSSNTSVVTNNGGDVNVEINLNIDHISSETDIDEMIQRVKDEIVDVARPEGTNVILQQQLN